MTDRQSTPTKPDRRRSAGSAPSATPTRRPDARRIGHSAAQQLAELIGKELEGVTGIERTEDGWTVDIDVLELHRIPATTDVLATYEVDVDGDGRLAGYRRAHRYVRWQTGKE